jgi:Glutamate-cysteine ligase family 2(GCS2)
MLAEDHTNRRQLGDLMATEPPTRPALRGIERPPAPATRPRVVIDDLIHLIGRLQLTPGATVPTLPTLLAALTVFAHQLLCLRARLRTSLRPRLRRILRRWLGTRARVLPSLLLKPLQPILVLLKPAREIENEPNTRLTPRVIDRLRLHAVHTCKIRCTNKESLPQAPTTERLPRTVIFQAFPRTGPPRFFANYPDYVETVDELIASGAIPDPSFLWWDVRPQPALGTVEVRVMDAQSRVQEVTPLVALIQSLARLELEEKASSLVPSPEVLSENRFLAARDGMDAHLIDPGARCLIPVREMVDSLLADCRSHALALGCAGALDRIPRLAAANGADRQRKFVALSPRLDDLVASLADQFLAPGWRAGIPGEEPGRIR